MRRSLPGQGHSGRHCAMVLKASHPLDISIESEALTDQAETVRGTVDRNALPHAPTSLPASLLGSLALLDERIA